MVVELVAKRFVEVNTDEEAFPNVVCPVTANVPFDVRDEVAVIEPPVNVLIVDVIAFNTVAKKLDDVAFVDERFVIVAFVPNKFVEVRTDEEAFPRVVCPVTARVPFDVRDEVAVIFPEVKSPAVIPEVIRFDIVVVARVEVPVTANVPFDVRDEVAVIEPPVRVLMEEVRKLPIFENKTDEVAFVVSTEVENIF